MEEEKHGLYFELLYLLANEGFEVETNIRDLCNKYVDKNHDDKEEGDAWDAFSKSWTRVMAVVESVRKAGYIEYSKDHDDFQQFYLVGGNFSAYITKEGLDYYYSDLLRKATIKSLNNQKPTNRITWGIAIISIILTVGVAIWATIQNKGLEQRIFQLEQSQRKNIASTPKHYPTHKIVDTTSKEK